VFSLPHVTRISKLTKNERSFQKADLQIPGKKEFTARPAKKNQEPVFFFASK
jgi:hypothetical protein